MVFFGSTGARLYFGSRPRTEPKGRGTREQQCDLEMSDESGPKRPPLSYIPSVSGGSDAPKQAMSTVASWAGVAFIGSTNRMMRC